MVAEAKAHEGEQVRLAICGWSLILSRNEVERAEDVERAEALMRERGIDPPPRPPLEEPNGHLGHAPDGSNWWRFSAMLIPAGRGSDDDDWRFLGFAAGAVGAPQDPVTPIASTPPNAVHHWTWTDSGYDVATEMRKAIALMHPDRETEADHDQSN